MGNSSSNCLNVMQKSKRELNIWSRILQIFRRLKKSKATKITDAPTEIKQEDKLDCTAKQCVEADKQTESDMKVLIRLINVNEKLKEELENNLDTSTSKTATEKTDVLRLMQKLENMSQDTRPFRQETPLPSEKELELIDIKSEGHMPAINSKRKQRPKAAKGFRKAPQSFTNAAFPAFVTDSEEDIVEFPTNIRDRRLRPKAAKGARTPMTFFPVNGTRRISASWSGYADVRKPRGTGARVSRSKGYRDEYTAVMKPRGTRARAKGSRSKGNCYEYSSVRKPRGTGAKGRGSRSKG
ncbi:hypothetical protein CHS0354_004125 [Potamilus streckersoni]|uniref:Uncharacterized protein n=1 Tax=Potamilus streckersoni TaxID=2493646 RepID=A0AAE0SJ60_9BIVA|nr:hypothetical protein CHS0354_004125 [Potamilus streckersoni]